MNIQIRSKSSEPIYEQIKNQIKEAVISGELEAGEPLPSIRNLARDLKISVITTKRAYEELEQEGMVYSVAGKGFYVDSPDTGYLVEKKMQSLEGQLEAVLLSCREAGISREDVKDMVDILWDEK